MLVHTYLLALLSLNLSAAPLEPEAAGESIEDLSARRPKVALVLSGGGAKGASHIGVIRYLREIGIPIDYVVGTSMGSLIGGMFSLGYDDKAMEDVMLGTDWPYYMGDGVERLQLSYRAKSIGDSYNLILPFGTDEILAPKDAILPERDKEVRKDLIQGMIPSGVISGNNILNLFYDFSIGYTDPVDFNDLPIPFACVSTDIVSGTAYVHRSGILAEALRSSMAIPGVFNPVYNRTQVLMDGGMRNNFPVDVAREMGADIVIGVNLAIEKENDPENLHSLTSQVQQLIKIFTSNNLEEHKGECDILINPDMKGRTSLDFSKKNLREVIDLGYAEAEKHEVELKALHQFLSEYGSTRQRYQAPKAKTLIGKTFKLSQINMIGVRSQDANWLIKRSGLEIGEEITMSSLTSAVSMFYGTKAYSKVLYTLKEDPFSDGYIVEFNFTREKPHSLDLGLRVDTHDAVQTGIRLAFNEQMYNGIQGEFSTVIAYNPSAEFVLSVAPRLFPRLSFSYEYSKRDADLYNIGSGKAYLTDNFRYHRNRFRIYASEYILHKTHYKFGTEYNYMTFPRAMCSYWEVSLDSKMKPARTLGLFAELSYDSMDDYYNPHFGTRIDISLRQNLWHFRESGVDFKPFTKLNFGFRYVEELSENLTIIPQAYGALSFDAACHWEREYYPVTFGEDMPLVFYPVYQECYGGPHPDYDFEGQVPFVGLYSSISEDNMLVARCDLRYSLLQNHFLTLKLNYGRSVEQDSLMEAGLDRLGVAFEYSFATKLGNISGELGWNNANRRVGLYLSIGKLF